MKKTKLTRSLLAACSIVALTAVMYGCVHDGGSDPEPMVEPMPEPELDVPKAPAPFRPGDHVGHARFGQGVVVACLETPTRDDFEVTVAFKGQGVKRLLAGLAGLEKLN